MRIIFEVAGKPAQVTAANPAGIIRDGYGFIITPKPRLTTDTSIVNRNNQKSAQEVLKHGVRTTDLG